MVHNQSTENVCVYRADSIPETAPNSETKKHCTTGPLERGGTSELQEVPSDVQHTSLIT